MSVKILYAAIDQTVPGTTGGSMHVTAVAEGLAALGHEVHVLVTPGDGGPPRRRPCTGSRCRRRSARATPAGCAPARRALGRRCGRT